MRRFLYFSFLFLSFLVPDISWAEGITLEGLHDQFQALNETVKILQSTVKQQADFIEKQNLRISTLEKGSGTRGTVPQNAVNPERAPQAVGLSQGFNPDIGVVGTVQAKLTKSSEDTEGQDTIALKEVELNFAQYVDPFSRFDAVISFNDQLESQNASIEEAYYTHWGLPLGFRGQIGKFRSKIGKQNLLHLDQLKTVDYPLVIRDFFGEEGLSSSGVRLQNNIPNPWDLPLEITGEVLRGNNGASFSGVSRRPIFSTHLKSFFEISKDSNFELGTTAMFGDENPPRMTGFDNTGEPTFIRDPKGQDRYGVKIFGLDATYVWNLSQSRTLLFQNEAYLQDRTSLVTVNQNPWGFYSLLDYRFSRLFSAGLRFDYLEPRAVRVFHETSYTISPYLTLWQSEFANFRVQYSHVESADPRAKTDDAVYLQANFLIGSHRHPVQ